MAEKGGRLCLKKKSAETSKETKGRFLLQEGWEFGSHGKRKNSTGTRKLVLEETKLKKEWRTRRKIFLQAGGRTAPCPALSGEKHGWLVGWVGKSDARRKRKHGADLKEEEEGKRRNL